MGGVDTTVTCDACHRSRKRWRDDSLVWEGPADLQTIMAMASFTSTLHTLLVAVLMALCLTTASFACKNGQAPPAGAICCGPAVVSGTSVANGLQCCSGVVYYAKPFGSPAKANVCYKGAVVALPKSILDGTGK